MRREYGKHWWWISFFAVYISQHTMLMGLTLPIYAVSQSPKPFMLFWDNVAKLICYIGTVKTLQGEGL